MRVLDTETVVVFPAPASTRGPVGNGSLACLHDTGLSDRFHFWRGASGCRYPVSISMIETIDAAATLPDFDGFVLVSVARSGPIRWPIAVRAIERSADRRAAIVEALAEGACEWHVHLLGSDRVARAAIVDDLRSRHGRKERALSA